MVLYERGDCLDRCSWRCMNIHCTVYGNHISIRRGSIFSNFPKSSLVDIFCTIFCWAQEKPLSTVTEDFGMPKKTVLKVFEYLRGVISDYVAREPVRLGGPGVICQIDESLFSHKVKAHRGRGPREQVWVFGIVDTSKTPAVGYMEVVERRNAETLLPIINRVVRAGSTIHSDEWAAYSSISSRLGFEHSVVNHSLNFVTPRTLTHTQHIESYWNKQKYRIKKMKGVRRDFLQKYLNEFMWRDSCTVDAYLALFILLKAKRE